MSEARFLAFQPAPLSKEADALIHTQTYITWVDLCKRLGEDAFSPFKIHQNISQGRNKLDALSKAVINLECTVDSPASSPVELSKQLKAIIANILRPLQEVIEERQNNRWEKLPTINLFTERTKTEVCIYNLDSRKPATFNGQHPDTESYYSSVKSFLTTNLELIDSYSKADFVNDSEFSIQTTELTSLESRLEKIKTAIKSRLHASVNTKAAVQLSHPQNIVIPTNNSAAILQQLAASSATSTSPKVSVPASVTRKGSDSPVSGSPSKISPSRVSNGSKSSESSVKNARELDLTLIKNPPEPSAPPEEPYAALHQDQASQAANNSAPKNACCVIQ